MKIYDKTLQQVFAEMTWQNKIIVSVGSIFLLFVLIYIPYKMFNLRVLAEGEPGPVNIIRSSVINQTLDPSLASDGKKVYMVATTTKSINKNILFHPIVFGSNKECKKWHINNTNTIKPNVEEVIGPDKRTPLGTGVWRIETPSIVYDPTDTSAPWKIFAHKYFWMNGKPLAQLYSMIIMSSAQKPEGQWSTEKWVFATNNDSPPSPYNDLIPIKLNALHPSLRHIKSYARPSVVGVDNYLVMTLSAYIAGRDTPDRVIMIASSNHGKTWQYLGTPLKHIDAQALDFTHISGASLIKKDGEVFLSAVFGNQETDGTGTHVFAFDNFSNGFLQRDTETKKPMATNIVPLISKVQNRTGGGFAGYSDTCSEGGIITSEFSVIQNAYTLFQTYEEPRPIDE